MQRLQGFQAVSGLPNIRESGYGPATAVPDLPKVIPDTLPDILTLAPTTIRG